MFLFDLNNKSINTTRRIIGEYVIHLTVRIYVVFIVLSSKQFPLSAKMICWRAGVRLTLSWRFVLDFYGIEVFLTSYQFCWK